MSAVETLPTKIETRPAEEDTRGGDVTPKAKTADASAAELENMEQLSPMRTHEQSGHSESVADRMCHLVGDSDEEDDTVEKEMNLEKLERKELKRQKTSDKPNRMRDRLKRTVSKTTN